MAKKLLLADDSITIQKVIGITFANEDYELTVVDNGVDCVAKAKEIRPDLILADVIMPEKDGYQVCEEIRKDVDLSGTPIILLTGTFESFDEARSKEVGASDYITKPFESQTLIDKVKNQLEAGGTQEAPAPEPQAEAAGVAIEAPTEEQPVEAPAVPEAMAVEEGVVDLDEDEIWNVSEEATAVDVTGAGGEPIAATQVPQEAVAESSEEAADEWSIEEFEEVSTEAEEISTEGAIPPVSESKAEEAISDEDLWGGMEFGEIEEAPQAESELSEVTADTAEPSLVEDEFAEFGGVEEVSQEGAQGLGGGEFSEFEDMTAESVEEVSAPAEAAPPAEDIFDVSEGLVEEPTIPSTPEVSLETAEASLEQAAPVSEESMVDLSAVAAAETEPLAAHISPDSTVTAPVSEVVEAAEAVEPPAQEIPQEQLEAVVSKVAKEVVEKIAWEIVPELAETLIMEEIKKLKAKIGG